MTIKRGLIYSIFLIFVFTLTNLLIIMASSWKCNAFLGLYKWFQAITFLVLLSYFFSKISRIAGVLLSTIVYLLYLSLVVYFVLFQNSPNIYFIKRLIQGSNHNIILSLICPLIILFFAALLNCLLIQKIKLKIKNKIIYLILLIAILVQFFIFPSANNELFSFGKTLLHKDEIIEYYQDIYLELIKKSEKNKENIISQVQKINQNNIPPYLDNIIILQIESLNGFLVSEKITPNFLEIAKNGILFPKFYSNSIETILGQENLLCSFPGSFKLTLVSSNFDKKIICWPEIMKNLGYKTFFLKSYDLSFARTKEFMKNLRFDEIHADDIMSKDDPQYLWGFREDIFYEKVFNYIEKNKEKRNFLYIEVGPTNHWPFHTPLGLENLVPYKNPKNHREKLQNTTFLQDKYLTVAWENINKLFPEKNYTLLILGDHGWPAEFHQNNTFNQRMAFEENFITSLVLVIGDEEKYKNIKINGVYSHLDILPTFLDFFQIDYSENKFSQSFWPELQGKEILNNKLIPLIQPSDYKCPLNFVKDNLKYQYNAKEKEITLYDLEKDPEEKNGQTIGSVSEENIKIIKKLLK